MILLDANIVIYAFCSNLPQHARIKAWLDSHMRARSDIRLSWMGIVAFIRISTNPRMAGAPLTLAAALDYIETLLGEPNVAILEPGIEHLRHFDEACQSGKATGNLVTDAHYAALAIEHGCTLASCDTDFARFPGLRWVNPLAPAE